MALVADTSLMWAECWRAVAWPSSRARASLPFASGNTPAGERIGTPRKRSSGRPTRISAVALNDSSSSVGKSNSMPSGSRLRISLSRTNRSIDSVSLPTTASSAPSSSVTVAPAALPGGGESASAFFMITRIRPAWRNPMTRPATAAAAPDRPAPANSRAVACTARSPPSSLMKGRAR